MISQDLSLRLPSLNAWPDQIACWLSSQYLRDSKCEPLPNPFIGMNGKNYIKEILVPTFRPTLKTIEKNVIAIFEDVY